MILNNLYIEHQEVNSTMLKEALIYCYNHMCFSTYPYISYHLESSKDTIVQYNSGNCIGLSYFVKQYLKNNYSIHSRQIVSTVPHHYRINGQPDICHVVLFICKSAYEYYIVDPAFYFLEPIHIDIRDNREKKIKTYDIHADKVSHLVYYVGKSAYVDHTFACISYFEDRPEHTFEYIFTEIANPDETIGKTFHSLKKEPFLIKTHYENDTIRKVYHIKKENNHLVVIHYNEVVYDGQPEWYDYTKLSELNKYMDPKLKLH